MLYGFTYLKILLGSYIHLLLILAFFKSSYCLKVIFYDLSAVET